MSDKPPARAKQMIAHDKPSIGYMAIAIFVLLSYVLVIGSYTNFANHVLPSGDPYTYTIGWFLKIDLSKSHYVQTLFDIISGADRSWYRLQNLLIAGFGPLLTKDPVVICVVNYFLWGVATAAFFRLGLYLELPSSRAFIVALVPWIWPTDYGFFDHHSIPVLALDSAFTAALHIALASTLIFAINPSSTFNAVLAALSIGIAIWGRGNSLPVVGLVVCAPCLIAFAKAWQSKDRRSWINIALVAVIPGAMIIEFYYTYWTPLHSYYGAHASFFERHTWVLKDAMPYLKNIPGFMYWHHEDSPWTMWLSWASHPIPLAAVVLCWRRRKQMERGQSLYYLAISGAVIYYGTFVANLVLWNDPVISLYNSLLIWRPMLIGLSLSVISLIVPLFDNWPGRFTEWRFMPYVGAALLAWGVLWTALLTPWQYAIGRPDPRTVERFALNVDQILGDKGQLSVLWYEAYNDRILTYYRLKNDLSPVPLYQGPYLENIWSMFDYSATNEGKIIDGVKDVFKNATLVIIPEYMDAYRDVQPYAFYKFRREWGGWLNSPEAPRMRVLMILQDSPIIRLLVLQREELAHGQGDPLHLPWGNRPAKPVEDYSAAVVRFR